MKITLDAINLDDPRIDSLVARARRIGGDEGDTCHLLLGALVAFGFELLAKGPTMLREAGQVLIDAATVQEQALAQEDKEP